MVLVGCGEGSSSSTTTLQKTEKVQENIVPTVKAKLPNSSDISYSDLFKVLDNSNKTAMITDAFSVEGLKVVCGTDEIKSDKYGMFTCDTLPLSVYIGNIKLGELSKINKDRIIYTQDLLHISRAATMHPDVTKLSVLLQSLDENGDVMDGIDITQSSVDILNQDLANFKTIQELTLDDINNAVNDVIATRKANDANLSMVKVSAHDAQIALTSALANTPARAVDATAYRSIAQ